MDDNRKKLDRMIEALRLAGDPSAEAIAYVHDVLELAWQVAKRAFKDEATPEHAILFYEVINQERLRIEACQRDGIASLN